MRRALTHSLTRAQQSFGAFTAGQKLVAVIGTAALLLGAFIAFRWAATPSYAPLFSGMAAKDASAVIEELDARGVPYELSDGGATIMVPQNLVYPTRIALSGEGLPSDNGGGYSILDSQGLSTSQFKEQTDFKRAMEGELARTIEAIDDVETAVVHLAIPAKRVFADEQDPTTASVLVDTRAGRQLNPGQVQAIVNLVASSIDGLAPDQVTVADSTGTVLSAPGGSTTASASTQTQQVQDFQDRMRGQVQTMLDRVLGPGNSAVEVTANLSFDKRITRTTRYFDDPTTLSSSETTERYSGAQGSQVGGTLGTTADTQEAASDSDEPTDDSDYAKSTRTSENVVNTTVEEREAAPGGVESLHVGVVLDEASLGGVAPTDVQALVASALGIDTERGDTVQVTAMPFDRSSEEATAKELQDAAAAEDRAHMVALGRNGFLVVLVAVMLLAAWLRSRGRAARREADSTLSWIEQLRRETERGAPDQPAIDATSPAMLLLQSEQGRTAEIREELAALVGRQPEDVAAVLRGWLSERT